MLMAQAFELMSLSLWLTVFSTASVAAFQIHGITADVAADGNAQLTSAPANSIQTMRATSEDKSSAQRSQGRNTNLASALVEPDGTVSGLMRAASLQQSTGLEDAGVHARVQSIQSNADEPRKSSEKDCLWELWQDWSECTVSCGGGDKLRKRSMARRAAEDGNECEGPSQQTDACNLEDCSTDAKTDSTVFNFHKAGARKTSAVFDFHRPNRRLERPDHADSSLKREGAEVEEKASMATEDIHGKPVADGKTIGLGDNAKKAIPGKPEEGENNESEDDVRIWMYVVVILVLYLCFEIFFCDHWRNWWKKGKKQRNAHAGPFNEHVHLRG